FDFQTGPPHRGEAATADFGVRVTGGRHHPLDAALYDGRYARRRALVKMATGFQRDVEGRATGPRPGLAQGEHLGMGPAGPPVIARTNNPPLLHDDCAHRRIRAGLACAAPGQRHGLRHEMLVLLANWRFFSYSHRNPHAQAKMTNSVPSLGAPIALWLQWVIGEGEGGG